MKAHGKPWVRGEGRTMYDNPWIRVTEHDSVAPTGRPALYGVVSFKNRAVAILPLHDDGTVVLVGQHRLPHGDYSWEVPEGGGPLDEAPLEAAKRELAEETGLATARVPFREALEAATAGNLSDILTVAMPLRAYHMAREGSLPPAVARAMLG
ncbi:MAG: NUDIX domain-containing protein [Phenylobacterium sp.]